jgi:hypothetical protein
MSSIIRILQVHPLSGDPGLAVQMIEPNDGNVREIGALALPCCEVAGGPTLAQVGQELYAALCKHPEAQARLDHHCRTPVGAIAPIFLEVEPHAADALPWEALCRDPWLAGADPAPAGFFALDYRLPVGRIVKPKVPLRRWRLCDGKVRVLAILSAAGIDPRIEAQRLIQAVDGRDFVDLEILVAEEAFVKAPGPLPANVTVKPLPSTPTRLRTAISDARPNVLHFNCHGTADEGGNLLLTSPLRWGKAGQENDLIVNADELATLPALKDDAWLVVLNCCEGGAARDDGRSIARTLGRAGVFAAIAMRCKISATAAAAFTAAFYPRLFDRLDGTLPAPDMEPLEIGLASLVPEPRRAIARKPGVALPASAHTQWEWTIPVLYTVEPSLHVYAAPTTALPAKDVVQLVDMVHQFVGQDSKPIDMLRKDVARRLYGGNT